MKTIATALIAIAAIITGCSTETQVSQAPQPPPARVVQSIDYDSAKVTREQVVSVITDIFSTHGYKSTLGRQSGVQFGAGGTTTQFEEGPVKFVTTERQPPTEGSNSQKWFYRAIIEDGSVELQVFVERAPYNLLGVTIDSDLTSWEPPDKKLVLQEIQNRLQPH